jgi:D-glycero-D-manno-heptose 1,7-bisphosphate phosphatase
VRTGGAEPQLSAVFLDRDGVINRKAPEGSYVTSWSQFEFLPTALEGLSQLAQLDVPIVIATNQRGVALGKLSLEELSAIHERMLSEVQRAGGRIDAVFYCPHDGGCNCRKPLPGMLTDAAVRFGFDVTASVLIGDSRSDMEAAAAVGARRVFVGAPTGDADEPGVHDLLEAARLVLSW